MKTALLLIEIQNDYFVNGRMPLERSIDACLKAQEILYAFRAKQLNIIHVQQFSTRPYDKHCFPCTKGVEFHPYVQPQKDEIIIKKHYPNSFKDTTLFNHLVKNQITHVLLAGMRTHVGIDATAKAASDLGFGCMVLHDACAAAHLEYNGHHIPAHQVHMAFTAALNPLFANIISTREYIQQLNVRTSPVTSQNHMSKTESF